jgi:hypothetical protein
VQHRQRRHTRTGALVALYTCSGTSLTTGVAALFAASYLVWVIGLVAGVTTLLGAYWVRTGHRPWTRHPHSPNPIKTRLPRR